MGGRMQLNSTKSVTHDDTTTLKAASTHAMASTVADEKMTTW